MVYNTEKRTLYVISRSIAGHSKDFCPEVLDLWIHFSFTVFKKRSNIHNILAFKGRRDLTAHKRHNKKLSTLMESVIHNRSPDTHPSASAEPSCHSLICAVNSIPFSKASLACSNVILIPEIYIVQILRDQDI